MCTSGDTWHHILVTSYPYDYDTDSDGVRNGDEYEEGTNPQKSDTDGDGLSEVFADVEVNGNILIVDSSGFRMGHTTEYIEYRHKLRRRKKWLKLHVITDGKRVVRLLITNPHTGDSPAFGKMFKTLKKELKNMDVVIGDSAYDSRENFNLIAENGIKPLIKVRKNSSTLSKGSPPRRRAVIEQRDPLWSKKSDYSKRWLVESLFSSMKRTFGEFLSSRKFNYAVRELIIMLSLFNLFHSL